MRTRWRQVSLFQTKVTWNLCFCSKQVCCLIRMYGLQSSREEKAHLRTTCQQISFFGTKCNVSELSYVPSSAAGVTLLSCNNNFTGFIHAFLFSPELAIVLSLSKKTALPKCNSPFPLPSFRERKSTLKPGRHFLLTRCNSFCQTGAPHSGQNL